MKRLAGWFLLPLLMAALVFSGWKTWQQADAYERETLIIIKQLETELAGIDPLASLGLTSPVASGSTGTSRTEARR